MGFRQHGGLVIDDNDRIVGFRNPSISGGLVQYIPTVVVDAEGNFVSLLGPDGEVIPLGGGEGGISDGDKGDITVASSGTVWSIENNAVVTAKIADSNVTDAKISNRTALSVWGRSANSTGVGADMAAGTDGHVLRRSGTTLGFGTLAAGAFAANTIPLTAVANITAQSVLVNATGSGAAPTAVALAASQLVGRGATGNIGVITLGTGLSMSAAVLNAACNLGYTASTRVLTSDIGTDVTLPLFTSTEAGLAPLSGGGTTNFLRADGTWAAPPGGGGSLTDGDKGDITVSGSGATWTVDNGLAATKIADGTVTNAEFQYLGGVTSDIQTQLDAKLDADLANDLSDGTAIAEDDELPYIDVSAADAVLKGAVSVLRNRLATIPIGTALGTTGSVALDFATLGGTRQSITLTGNLTLTTSNLAAGRGLELRIAAGASGRTIAYPAWVAFGAALPTSLASGEVLILSLFANSTTDGSVDAVAVVSA